MTHSESVSDLVRFMATISSSPVNPIAQPHLVSLVLQSKKALQHGEQLCTRAHVASNASAQAAVDVLALDAKVRWISEAVIEQLKVSSVVTDFS
jgi:autophagy-related protein 17